MTAAEIVDDPVLQRCGKKAGLEIWRVENFKLVAVPDQQHGSFFEGDAYMVLKTTASRTGSGVRLSWNLHFWLGEEASQDEQGTAAILAVAIDDALGGAPVQFREVQANESTAFKSYFKTGLIYKKGGMASGFKHVKTNDFSDVRRLLHVKGKRNVQAKEVDFSWSAFNSGDSFIVDIGHLLVVYNAPGSNIQEKRKANALANDIRDRERAGRARVEIIDASKKIQDVKNSGEHGERIAKIEELFGEPIPSQFSAPTKDEVADAQASKACRLFHVSDATGQVVVKEVASSPLTQSLLLHEDSYILDQGPGSKIFVWKGKLASKQERQQSMSYALQYIEKRGYNKKTPIEMMADGGESATFKQLFKAWKGKYTVTGPGKVYSVNKVAKQNHAKFDAKTLHADPRQAAEQRMPDDGQGEVKVWRIESSKMVTIEAKHYGQFYTGDSYLILYTYNRNGKEAHIVYMWQGLKSPADERAACAFLAVGLDDHYGGEPVQVRVEQGHEPRHFLEMFKGKFIIFEGGYDSQNHEQTISSDTRLFHVKGNTTYSTKAVEVAVGAARLNSSDCFVLSHAGGAMVWCGRGSNGDEREMAKGICGKMSNNTELVVIAEGHESGEFWTLMGGKGDYQKTIDEKGDDVSEYDGRLFECSNASGRFTVEEITDFQQTDLDPTDIMLLDAWECIFMWVGIEANEEEKTLSVQAAVDYLASHPADRSASTPLITVKQGYEPFNFTGWFQAWDPLFWGEVSWDNYVAPGIETKSSVELNQKSIEIAMSNRQSRGKKGMHFEYAELIVEKDELPAGVDYMHREQYLSNAAFKAVFAVEKAEFNRMKAWKKEALKKQYKLF